MTVDPEDSPTPKPLHLSTAAPFTRGYVPWSKFNEHAWSKFNAQQHRDPNRPDKVERRAAELLVHRRLPSDGLLGVACFDDPARARIQDWADSIDSKLPVRVRRDWYF